MIFYDLLTALLPYLMTQEVVQKAVCKWRPDTVQKSWKDDTQNTYFEGWLATPDVDADGEVTEPEAFLPVIDGYARLNMPLTSEHETEPLPVGHLQKMAVIRDGVVLKSAQHPTDAADFAYLPTSGSGVWVRGVVNTPSHAHAVANGNLGGMSFIASIKDAEPAGSFPRHLKEFSALWETTLAAYPRNRNAHVQRAMKAYITPQETPPAMTKEELEAILAKFAPQAAPAATEATPEYVTKAGLDTALADAFKQFAAQFGEQVKATVEETVQKAIPAPSREGVGRVTAGQEGQGDDAVTALIKKAGDEKQALSYEDKDMILALTAKAFVGDLLSDTGNRK